MGGITLSRGTGNQKISVDKVVCSSLCLALLYYALFTMNGSGITKEQLKAEPKV